MEGGLKNAALHHCFPSRSGLPSSSPDGSTSQASRRGVSLSERMSETVRTRLKLLLSLVQTQVGVGDRREDPVELHGGGIPGSPRAGGQ